MPIHVSAHSQVHCLCPAMPAGARTFQGGAQAIKARGLDLFYNLEEDMLSGKADTAAMLRLIQVPD